MSGPDSHWVKSSRSYSNGNCVEVAFRKSSRSFHEANCAEVAACPHGVLVRDSKDPDGSRLSFTPEEWRAFLGGVRNGDFG